jgi:fermentation-respiration switch protein FrsA (DUF1100 family)
MRIKKAIVFALTLLFAVAAFSLSRAEQKIEGIWLGTLTVPGAELRIVINLSKNADGKLVATLDSPDQGAKGIPVEEVSFVNGHLHLAAKSLNGGYEGNLNSDGSSIDGTWSQNGGSLPLNVKRVDKVEEKVRPQDPISPYPYEAKEVSYLNKNANITLAGTLTLPRSGGAFPAVILITGSGAEDRNATVFGHRPILVLADYLTRRGIAVLRVDDRGVGSSTGNTAKSTSNDFAGDVLAGIDYLKSLKEINPKQIGLIGHSEGGIIAPMVAIQSPDVAFIVLMAGPGETGEQIIYSQAALILKASGVPDEEIAKDRKIKELTFGVVKAEPNDSLATIKLHATLDSVLAKLSPEERAGFGYTPEAIDGIIKEILSPWFRTFLTYDPIPTLTKVKCPVLAINGEKDMQVPPKENLKAISDALKAGGNKVYTATELPGMNHLFQMAETGSPMEYATIDETISPKALATIGDWIIARTRPKK